MAETSLEKNFKCSLRILEGIFQGLNENVHALRDLRVLDGLTDEVEGF